MFDPQVNLKVYQLKAKESRLINLQKTYKNKQTTKKLSNNRV